MKATDWHENVSALVDLVARASVTNLMNLAISFGDDEDMTFVNGVRERMTEACRKVTGNRQETTKMNVADFRLMLIASLSQLVKELEATDPCT